jgi:hypothetical protein
MEIGMFKNGMRPVHPGEILLEDYIKPMGVSVRALSLAFTFLTRGFAKSSMASGGFLPILHYGLNAISAAMRKAG